MRVGGWGGGVGGGVGEGGSRNRERKWEKESTCGSHYSVGQDAVVLHGAFCRGALERLSGCGKDGENAHILYVRTGGPENALLKNTTFVF